jgi:hypothetical protein
VPVCLCASPTRIARWKHPFHRNGPKNLITTLVPTDGVLLKACNRKQRCHTWSLIATTSHVRTLSMLLYSNTRLARAVPYSSQVLAIRLGFACVCPTSVGYTPCFLLSPSYTLIHPYVPTILVSHPLNLKASFIIFQTSPPFIISGQDFF